MTAAILHTGESTTGSEHTSLALALSEREREGDPLKNARAEVTERLMSEKRKA